MAVSQQTKATPRIHPLLTGRERLLLWEKVRGMWKHRKPNPLTELRVMRKEWDRKLPKLSE